MGASQYALIDIQTRAALSFWVNVYGRNVGVEHWLLAILGKDAGIAKVLAEGPKVTTFTVQDTLREVIQSGELPLAAVGDRRWTPGAVELLKRAAAIAAESGRPDEILRADILEALYESNDPMVSLLLGGTFLIDRDTVIEKVRAAAAEAEAKAKALAAAS